MPTQPISDWVIEFQIGDVMPPIRLNVHPEILVGRVDPDQPSFEGLDLTSYDGINLGVSRRHAIIRWEGNHLVVIDSGSNNGTVLNGARLLPQTPYRLNSDDVLYFGHLKTTIQINSQVGQSYIRAKRIDFNTNNVPQMARGQRILVVEDDVMIAKLYQIGLEKVGFSVQNARDVVGAIRALNQVTPSLIVLDLRLPSVHGLELARYVRRDTECPDIPIIVVSAISAEETVQQAMDAGVDIFMVKPVDIAQLSLIISAIVYKFESENPTHGTKKLAGTASLDYITPSSHDDAIVIFVENQRQPIGTVVQPQITLGRQAMTSTTRNHIDLDEYNAFEKGVSRLHAKIERKEGVFFIEDLGSSNGTFVNGRSLRPHEPARIANGDEIRLGEMRMHVYLLTESEPARSQA